VSSNPHESGTKPVTVQDKPVGLAEAIRQVGAELAVARREGEHDELRFRLGEVQLQFEVQLSREGGGEVGVNVWVVSVGAKGSVTSGQTHTVTVTMVPQTVDADGTARDVLVGDAVKDLPPLPQAR
jgi:hypothetical protein